MTSPADFARHLEGDGHHDWTAWLILADCLADQGLWEEAEDLRQDILLEQAPDQLNSKEEYILILRSGRIIHIPRHLPIDD